MVCFPFVLQLLCVRARDAICDAIRDARGTKPAPPERGSVADLPLFVTAYHDRWAAARGWVCNSCLSSGQLPHLLRMLAAVALLPACHDTALLTVALPPLPCRLTIYRDMSGDSLHRCCLGARLGGTDQPGRCNHSCVGKLDAVQHLCMCKVPAPASNSHHDKLGCLSFPPLQARIPPGNAPRLAERVGSSWHPVPERLGGAVPPGGRRCEMCLGGAAAAGLGSGHEGRLGETVGAAGAVLKSGGAELVFWTIVSSPLSRAANVVPRAACTPALPS